MCRLHCFLSLCLHLNGNMNNVKIMMNQKQKKLKGTRRRVIDLWSLMVCWKCKGEKCPFILRAAICPYCFATLIGAKRIFTSRLVLSPGNMVHHRSKVSWAVQLHCLQTLVVCLQDALNAVAVRIFHVSVLKRREKGENQFHGLGECIYQMKKDQDLYHSTVVSWDVIYLFLITRSCTKYIN